MNSWSGRTRRAAGLTFAALALTVSAGGAFATPGKPVLALDGLDPVALCEGRDLPGSPADSVVDGRFVYRFATPANRLRFLSAPARWGIQNGGACGKMGVLSGAGSPRRWYVHEGRVYVFASETCRDRFRADPASFVHRADPVPEPTSGEAQRARNVLDRAARAFGPALDRLRALELEVTARYVARDSSVSTARRLHQWEFPGRYREHEEWSGVAYGYAVDGTASFQFDGDVEWRHHADVAQVVLRQVWREPLLLVRSRRDPALVARWAGQAPLAGEQADLVEVASHGATTVLAVGVRSGRVLEARFTARTVEGDRPVVQRYSDFREAGGLVLPHLSERYEGEARRSPELRLASVKPDPLLTAGRFTPGD